MSIRNAFWNSWRNSYNFLFGPCSDGEFLLPVLFIISSLMLFFSKVVFPFSRIVGIFLLFVSILSIIHLRYPWMSCTAPPPRVIRRIRWFCDKLLLRQVLGISSVGAAAIFITLLIIAVLLTFEVLLGGIFAL